MTFQNVNFGRVVQSVVFIFVIAMVLYGVSCALLLMAPAGVSSNFWEIFRDFDDPDASQAELQENAQVELEVWLNDYSSELTMSSMIQWVLVALITLFFAQRTAREAYSPEQAVGYGVMVGLGSMLTYGLLCVMCISFAGFGLRIIFMGLLVVAGYVGGRFAANNLDPSRVAEGTAPDLATALPPGLLTHPKAGPPGGGDPSVFYNMGVAAALGGRRDEARQHFTRTLQMQPRNIAAWLQLANLADSPEQAWGYIQQARAISPNDPSVVEAVNVIWPQVHARTVQQSNQVIPPAAPPTGTPPPAAPSMPTSPAGGPPLNQPPYQGGTLDDPDIPSTTLPGSDGPDQDDAF